MTSPAQSALVSEMLAAVESDLRAATSLLDPGPYAGMVEMVGHHFGWSETGDQPGGKRIRPMLTLLCCAAAGGDWQDALPAASSVELIHNFSLIHDDIEDQSRERRSRPTLWARWGIAQALNTGDAMLVMARLSAFRLRALGHSDAVVLDVSRTLDEACLHLTKGQHLDLAFENRDDVTVEMYLEMIEGKTGALIAGATAAGAALARSAPRALEAYRSFGRHLGLAFQVLDDTLGIWGAPQVTGKPAGDDLAARKKTLPVIFGLEHSAAFRELWPSGKASREAIKGLTRELESCGALDHARATAASHTDRALESLARARPAGPAAGELRELALRLLQRDH